ncbi:MAG: putative permease [Syntrophaceae bacterium PtaU1.Bin231]|nr:MAG: putative permease [Syntrophaceae bacterium PtaU1.Bin231]HOG16913.1 permease [Syntrophales bacterium]
MLEMNNFVTAGRFFLVIAGELVLIFVAVSFLIGILAEYLPPSRIREFLAGKMTWVQYLLGAGLGALTPFCSCSTVPITAGLLKGGVPFGPVMAFLFSSPVLNPVIIALLLSLLGIKVTAAYMAVTFFGSMATAALLSKMKMEREVKSLVGLEASCCDKAEKRAADPVNAPSAAAARPVSSSAAPVTLATLPAFPAAGGCCGGAAAAEKARQGSCCSVGFAADGEGFAEQVPFRDKMKRAATSAADTFKGVFWYLLLGAAIGAFIYGFFPQDLVVRLAGPGNPWSIPTAAFIGVPMYIRAETVIPISAALVEKGMGVGTVLALIIGGAGASVPEIIILGSMFRKKLIFAFVATVFAVAIAAGYFVDLLIY